TFSTIAQNQLQAMQMSMMFFLPNILLSGFMFPFAGMPAWAQWIGEFLPLTHYLRIVRGIMLKGAVLADLRYDTLALATLMLIAMIIAITRFRRTLDSRRVFAAAATHHSGTRHSRAYPRSAAPNNRGLARAFSTEETVLTNLRPQCRVAASARIEKLAGIGRHRLRFRGPAMRTGDDRFKDHG